MRLFRRYCWTFLLFVTGAGWQFGQEFVFKQDVKLVEVYASVIDHKGREVDGLTKDQFEIRDDGRPQPIRVFEPASGALSCALLLDTTGSMTYAMPRVRNATRKLIDSFRPDDLVGLYTFTDRLEQLQEPTTDRGAMKRAVVDLHTGGLTALFDSLTQVAIEMEKKPGKKAIIVLTDGGDNISVLNPDAAAARMKKTGIPVFVISEGEAARSDTATAVLRDLSNTTAGMMYTPNHFKEIGEVFDEIGRRARNGYLLAFVSQPEKEKSKSWHELQVLVKNAPEPLRVRAR